MYDGFLEGSIDLYFNMIVNQIPGSEMHRFKPDGLPHLWYTELVIMGWSAGIVHIGSSQLFLGYWIQKNHSSLSGACQNFHKAYCLTRLWLLTIEVSLYQTKLIWKLIMIKDHLKVLNIIFGIHLLLMYLLLFFPTDCTARISCRTILNSYACELTFKDEIKKAINAMQQSFRKAMYLEWWKITWSCNLCMQHANCNHQSFGDCSPTALQTPFFILKLLMQENKSSQRHHQKSW